tara:strand:- start:187 stop:297 length:111 start_codon:yes stop_codon:yes gene_type:complete
MVNTVSDIEVGFFKFIEKEPRKTDLIERFCDVFGRF